jgi:hypothetical protein
MTRIFDRIVTAPWRIADTHSVVVASADDTSRTLNTLDDRVAVLDERITSLGTKLEAVFEAQFEAVTLLTRAVNELNSRLQDGARFDESLDS